LAELGARAEIGGGAKQNYIAGIDGLRAIAVLAVLAFHAFPMLVPGGYIGVDLFFVISGFIITRTYFDRLADSRVTLKYFYIKRVRRLAPVYFLVISATSIAAYLLLEPPLLKNFSLSLGAQAVYLQNFVFWAQGDYFQSALTRPLLHTWSLGVEEQFYLAYGVAILIARRLPRFAIVLIALATIASYAVGDLLAVVSPKTNFFLLPARLWEFGIGFAVARVGVTLPRRLVSPVRCAGLLMIAGSIFGYSEAAIFPGPQAILACFGAGLMLLTYSAAKPAATVLGHPVMTYFGRISYALYLWHWPIIALGATYLGRALTPIEASAALLGAWFLSHISHIYVEEPFRRRVLMPRNVELLAGALLASSVVIIVASVLWATNGATFRYQEQVAKLYRAEQVKSPYRCSYWKRITGYPSEMCPIATPKNIELGSALVLGDSHADQLDEMIGEEGAQYGAKVFLTTRNCTLDSFGSSRYCGWQVLERVIDEIEEKKIKFVFAISYTDENIATERVRQSVQKLLSSSVEHLFIMQTVPNGGFFDPAQRIRGIRAGRIEPWSYTMDQYLRNTKKQRALYEEIAESSPRVSVLSSAPLLCPQGACDFERSGKPLYFDSNHLSPTGAEALRPLYEKTFKRLSRGS
jgi:peptidoglycan/LPS O-acetylase OafA/YrhL